MRIGAILLLIMLLLMVAAAPAWPYSHTWGYGPCEVLGGVALVTLILVLLGVLT